MRSNPLKSFLVTTLRRVLRPIVRIALRGELTHKEFAELTKLAYFDVARDDFGIAGRKTNIARVAILTGLSRKECTRLKALANAEPSVTGAMSPATRVITAWHEDPGYRTPDGVPPVLPFDGDQPSVSDLFRRHAGDIPSGALFAELQRIGAIEAAGDNRWRVIKRSFIADGFSRDKIRILGNQLSDLGDTIVHNIETDKDEDRRIQRYVVVDAITAEDAAAFRVMAARKGQELLEEFDAWLTSRALDEKARSKSRSAQRVGLGIYYFQSDSTFGEDQ